MQVRALELYSGIGGMHYALLESGIQNAKVIAAVDISPLPNSVYHHNFPQTLLVEKGIEGLSVKTLNSLNFNMLIMSPPCQPFTRIGLKKDIQDPRTKSFLHLLTLLPQLKSPVKYILLENVKGFEDSKVHQMFCDLLDAQGYSRLGFLISPKDLGIPNSRLRYYLLAKHSSLDFDKNWHDSSGAILHHLPSQYLIKSQLDTKHCYKNSGETQACRKVREFLEETEDTDELYCLSEQVLKRYLPVMDIVTAESTGTTCFTKSYGHYVEGTGSILNVAPIDDSTNDMLHKRKEDVKLRYFSPREIANIMCFPKDGLAFPENLTIKQQYRLLGNSLNVYVVACLLKFLVGNGS